MDTEEIKKQRAIRRKEKRDYLNPPPRKLSKRKPIEAGRKLPRYPYAFKKIAKVIRSEIKSCEQCGSNEYMQLHHKDKNTHNNDRVNLILLCFDCHKLEHTHLHLAPWQRTTR